MKILYDITVVNKEKAPIMTQTPLTRCQQMDESGNQTLSGDMAAHQVDAVNIRFWRDY